MQKYHRFYDNTLDRGNPPTSAHRPLSGFTRILAELVPYIRPGGHIAITIRPWREHAELIDVPSQILACCGATTSSTAWCSGRSTHWKEPAVRVDLFLAADCHRHRTVLTRALGGFAGSPVASEHIGDYPSPTVLVDVMNAATGAGGLLVPIGPARHSLVRQRLPSVHIGVLSRREGPAGQADW